MSLFVALALASFITSLVIHARANGSDAEAQLNRTLVSVSAHLSGLKSGV
ncbi:MAG: hypothetical protein KGH60_04240 [Candidatus Micrarchaeota archaeon]|nr:hypothetical protein [Candidatus Micrarchaeota archaeon]